MCETRVGCVGEVAEIIRLTVSQWACPGLAATLPLPMVGGRFEDERGGVVPSMGNARPSMARRFLAMPLAASGLPSSGLLALACVPTCVACAKGVVEGLLGGLPVSEPGVCCDTGLCVGVDAARLTEFLHDWARHV